MPDIIDNDAPVIVLLPPEDLIIPLHGTFSEPGVYTVDGTSTGAVTLTSLGEEALTVALASSDMADLGEEVTLQGTAIFGPWVISYIAVDPAGNAADPVFRRVYIDASCPGSETRCPDTAACSTSSLCLPSFEATNDAVEVYVPPVDTVAPQLTPMLAGEDTLLFNEAGGWLIAETRVLVGSAYVDSGATADDAVDGNLTASVSQYGVKAVSTAAPTGPSSPFVIQYRVADAAGNESRATRRVHVDCPSSEVVCTDASANALRFCSVLGICVPTLSTDDTLDTIGASPPRIDLIGPAAVHIPVGTVYSKCSSPRPLPDVCDQVCLVSLCLVFANKFAMGDCAAALAGRESK